MTLCICHTYNYLFWYCVYAILGAQWLSGRVLDPRVWASPASLRCGPWARHIYPSLVLVQPKKTRPCLTERLLMGRKESNQTNKYMPYIQLYLMVLRICRTYNYILWYCVYAIHTIISYGIAYRNPTVKPWWALLKTCHQAPTLSTTYNTLILKYWAWLCLYDVSWSNAQISWKMH